MTCKVQRGVEDGKRNLVGGWKLETGRRCHAFCMFAHKHGAVVSRVLSAGADCRVEGGRTGALAVNSSRFNCTIQCTSHKRLSSSPREDVAFRNNGRAQVSS